MIRAYTPRFGSPVLHLTSGDSLIVTLCVGASNLMWLPVMGALSDRIGRRPLLVGCTLMLMGTGYPAMLWLGGLPALLEAARRGALVLVPVWQLQRRDGGVSHRDHARRSTHHGLLVRVQPRGGVVRWFHAGHQHLPDSDDGYSRGAG